MSDFPIVGVGASAGGLDAYKRLLASLPPETGAAFILIQHLDPKHQSMMVDLLSGHTKMHVVQAEDAMALAPDTVFVIPPGKYIRVADKMLFLEAPREGDVVRLSIDHFFRSLAETRGERSIGIVLSGTGSDGTAGLREIRAAGGMVIVQEPSEADYDGMPRSAVATGLVDRVVAVDEMGPTLMRFLRHGYHHRREQTGGLEPAEREGFETILGMLRRNTDYDFHSYKSGTVERRIRRRMGLQQIETLEDYAAHMRETPDEAAELFHDLLIGVTRFFREPEAWDALSELVIGPLVASRAGRDPIRVWVPGCASGEEAYTLAITIFERLGALGSPRPVQIFATDLNARAIEAARSGAYPASIAGDVPPAILAKYFVAEEDGYRVVQRLRETVVFAAQNVISDPPFSKLDLITCRNLMIYLQPEVQQRVIEMFHFALAADGCLFLGNSESADRPRRLFEALDKTNRIYRRRDVERTGPRSLPVRATGRGRQARAGRSDARSDISSITDIAQRQLLDRFAPASVLIDGAQEVLYYHGPVRNYLDFPSGEPSSNLVAIVTAALRDKLRTLLNGLGKENRPSEALVRNVPRDGGAVSVLIQAERVKDRASSEPATLVWFIDVAEPADVQTEAGRNAAVAATSADRLGQIEDLEFELKSTREDLHSTIEEMETSNEELNASNEELMSMNEELQSTNEELETGREELQSLNEELVTVNAQLEDKIGEVEATVNDLDNLLTSTNIGVVFLDTEMVIRRFTPAIKDIMRMIDSDVGRPVEDIAMRAQDETLLEDARACLETLSESEAEILTESGLALIRRLRPYRTSANRIEGVVVTYTDITGLRASRELAQLRELQQKAVAELGQMALSMVPLDELLNRAVRSIAEHLGVGYVDVLQLEPGGRALRLRAGTGWRDGLVGSALVPVDDRSQVGYTLLRSEPVVVENFAEERRCDPPDLLREHGITCGASLIIGPSESPWGILGAHETGSGRRVFGSDDVHFLQSIANALWLGIASTEQRRATEGERQRLREMTDTLPIVFAIIDAERRYEFVNGSFQRFGLTPAKVVGRSFGSILDQDVVETATRFLDKALAGTAQEYSIRTALRPGGEPRDFRISLAPRLSETGAVTGVYSAAVDITAEAEARREGLRIAALYGAIGDSIPYGVWVTDAKGRLTHVSQAFLDLVGLTFEEARDFGWSSRLAGDPEQTIAAWTRCIATGDEWEMEHEFLGQDGLVYCVLSIGRPVRDGDGKIMSWVGLNLDITRRREEEIRLRTISEELDHRVKNILATVSTVARMTARNAQTLDEYRESLEARLLALSRAHNVLAESRWTGMDLGVMLKRELSPYLEGLAKVRVDGPPIYLHPSAAQAMALAFHELTTNAAKHGALGRERGELAVDWSLRHDPEMPIVINWSETGVGDVATPEATGFGTVVINNVLVSQLNAEIDVDYPEDGMQLRITLPGSVLGRRIEA